MLSLVHRYAVNPLYCDFYRRMIATLLVFRSGVTAPGLGLDCRLTDTSRRGHVCERRWPCAVGQYSAVSQVSCTWCASGTVDTDSDPATPCTACAPGRYSPDNATQCLDCVAGFADTDGQSSTPCAQCLVGFYSAGAGPLMMGTFQIGYAYATSCNECAAGQHDNDDNASTACVACPSGTHSTAQANSTGCIQCTAGRFDHDTNAATPCASCTRGRYQNATGSAFAHECSG